MSKLIGITASVEREEETNYLNNSYIKAFNRNYLNYLKEGIKDETVAIIIPMPEANRLEFGVTALSVAQLEAMAETVIKSLDALILSGGADLNPLITSNENNTASYGCNAHRDLYEQLLIEAAIKQKVPIMGICRGFQILGRFLELPNYQQDLADFSELHSSNERSIQSRNEPTHPIHLYHGFKKFMGIEEICINSFHHQGFTFSPTKGIATKDRMKIVTDGIRDVKILASTDQVIEAFELEKDKIFACQFHPEEYGPESKTIQYFLEKYL